MKQLFEQYFLGFPRATLEDEAVNMLEELSDDLCSNLDLEGHECIDFELFPDYMRVVGSFVASYVQFDIETPNNITVKGEEHVDALVYSYIGGSIKMVSAFCDVGLVAFNYKNPNVHLISSYSPQLANLGDDLNQLITVDDSFGYDSRLFSFLRQLHRGSDSGACVNALMWQHELLDKGQKILHKNPFTYSSR